MKDGQLYISFLLPSMEKDTKLTPERKARLIEACRRQLSAYESAFGWKVPLTQVEVFTEGRWAASGGIPNGGGCYLPPSRIGVVAGDDVVRDLCHELNHQRLWILIGNKGLEHRDPSFVWAEAIGQQVSEQLRKERSQKHGRNP